jgi:hypothetical protein
MFEASCLQLSLLLRSQLRLVSSSTKSFASLITIFGPTGVVNADSANQFNEQASGVTSVTGTTAIYTPLIRSEAERTQFEIGLHGGGPLGGRIASFNFTNRAWYVAASNMSYYLPLQFTLSSAVVGWDFATHQYASAAAIAALRSGLETAGPAYPFVSVNIGFGWFTCLPVYRNTSSFACASSILSHVVLTRDATFAF